MSGFQERIAQVRERFKAFEDWEDRYKELIQVGKEMPTYPENERQEKYKVKGCQSQVWLFPQFLEGRVRFHADSDALLVKGILAVLVSVYDNATPEEILGERGDFLKEIGITEHLSMNRTNGLASMVKQISLYAAVYKSLGSRA